MPTYEIAGPDVETAAKKLCTEHYHELIDAEVTFQFMLASSKEDEPAISHNGWPALGLCKVMSLKDRVGGLPDVRILLDAQFWMDAPPPERMALLDHELNHVEVIELPASKRTGANRWKHDDAGRPRCRLRQHDWQFGGFDVILERHKKASQEARVAEMLNRKAVQLQLF